MNFSENEMYSYENELKLISKYGLLSKDKNKTLDNFDFVLDCMKNNGI